MTSRILVAIFNSLLEKNAQNPSHIFCVEQLPNNLPPAVSITVRVCQFRHVELLSRSLHCMVHTSGGGSESLPGRFGQYTAITALEWTSFSLSCDGLGAQPYKSSTLYIYHYTYKSCTLYEYNYTYKSGLLYNLPLHLQVLYTTLTITLTSLVHFTFTITLMSLVHFTFTITLASLVFFIIYHYTTSLVHYTYHYTYKSCTLYIYHCTYESCTLYIYVYTYKS